MIRVLFIDDDPEWHSGLRDFLRSEPDIELSACASSVAEAWPLLEQTRYDVVLLDVRLGDRSPTGADAAADLHMAFPGVRIVMFSSLDDDDTFNEAFLNGAFDFIYKYELDKLPDVIRAAARHEQSKYGERLRTLLIERKRQLLQDADRELLALLAAGHSQQEIAVRQHVSEEAVKKRVKRLRKKFDWERSTLELAERCRMWGLLDEAP